MEKQPQKTSELLHHEDNHTSEDQSLTESGKTQERPGLEDKHDLLEEIAGLEHEQWVEWTQAVAKDLWPERRKRWEAYWVPYEQLPESAKDFPRKWAQKIMDLIESNMPLVSGKKHGIEIIEPAHNHNLESEKVSHKR